MIPTQMLNKQIALTVHAGVFLLCAIFTKAIMPTEKRLIIDLKSVNH